MGHLTKKQLIAWLSMENVLKTPTYFLAERIWYSLPALMTEKGVEKIRSMRAKVKKYKDMAAKNKELAEKASEYLHAMNETAKLHRQAQLDAQMWMAKYAELKDRGYIPRPKHEIP